MSDVNRDTLKSEKRFLAITEKTSSKNQTAQLESGFLIKEINERSDFVKVGDACCFTFFKDNNDLKQTIEFTKNYTQGMKDKIEAVAYNIDLDPRNVNSRFDEISKLVHGSGGMSRDSMFGFSGGSHLVLTKTSLAYICQYENNEDQFVRVSMLLALAIAYRKVMEDFSGKAAALLYKHEDYKSKGETDEENLVDIIELYEKISAFNTVYYFKNVISLNAHETAQIWNLIRDRWQIVEKNEEMTRQLHSIAGIIERRHIKLVAKREQAAKNQSEKLQHEADARAEEHRKREVDAENRLNRKFSQAGIFIAVLSLLSFDITPDKISRFFSSWNQYYQKVDNNLSFEWISTIKTLNLTIDKEVSPILKKLNHANSSKKPKK